MHSLLAKLLEGRQRWLGAAAALALSCGPAADAPGPQTATAASRSDAAFAVLAEGLCPKLEVFAAGDKLFMAFGTYGLDAVRFAHARGRDERLRAAQSFVELTLGAPSRDPVALAGLPLDAQGYIPGDIELGGRWPDSLWLAQIEANRGGSARGVLYARRRHYYGWSSSGWTLDPRARDAATPGMMAPELPRARLCAGIGSNLQFSIYATERLPSGDSLVAGRCEDRLHRATGGVRIASYVAGEPSWKITDAPESRIFDSIVNLGILLPTRRHALLYAYPPYETKLVPAYLAQHDGSVWSKLPVQFAGPIVSVAQADDGTIWAISGWRRLWKRSAGSWSEVTLPSTAFVDPPAERLRLLAVQAVGGALWVHAAYPVEIEEGDRAAARSHVLFTTLPVDQPLYCDRRRPASKALSEQGPMLHGATEQH